MTPTLAIVLLWLGFIATHMGLSSLRIQGALAGRLGQNVFTGVYSLVSLVFFVPLVWIYFTHRHAGPWLWILPHGPLMLWIMYLGMGFAFVLLAAGIARPSPAAVVPGDPTAAGIYRITRHPVMMAIAIFGLLHTLFNGSSADVAFFGGFVVLALAGARHQDRRKLAMDLPGFRQFYEQTSFLPFTGAGWTGALRELSPLVVVGIMLAIAVRYLH